MKTVIVGNGGIAKTHIDAIRGIGSEVSFIVGRDSERTRLFSEKHGIPGYTTDLSEALSGDADAVHICTPPYNHGMLIRQCIEAGKHLICEKPLCIDPTEAAELAALARKAREDKGIVTALCCNVRYYPANINAAGRIRKSYEGGPVIFHGSYLQQFHIPPIPDGWRFDSELSEGMRAISEIGTHWIDLAHAWTGIKISEVFADLRCRYPRLYRKDGMLVEEESDSPVDLVTEDSAAVLLRFEGGGMGCLLLSETFPGHPNDLTIDFTDMKTSCRWAESDCERLYLSSRSSIQALDLPVKDRTETFKALFRKVYAAAEGRGADDFPNFDDGLYISRVCSAIKESHLKQEWVRIDH